MKVLGIGVLSSAGRGREAFQGSLAAGWCEPDRVTAGSRELPCYRVDLERIPDRTVLKKLRRADKLSKMAVLAATDAVADSGLGEADRKKLGIILATAFGAHVTTFEFLDGILDFGEAAVSPTVFSNSVHNAAASYVSSALGIQGPTLTVTQFFFSFHVALQLAGAWLKEDRVAHVLVGAVDQLGDVMIHLYGAKLGIAMDGRMRPFQEGPPAAVPGEGAAFLLLGKEGADAYCSASAAFSSTAKGPEPDLTIIDADGLLTDEAAYLRSLDPAAPVASYAPLYGSMMMGSAFSAVAGAITIRDQRLYPNPVPDGEPRPGILREPADSSVEFVKCIRYNCQGERAEIHLRKA